MKDAGSARESRSKSRKRRPCYRIPAPCYVIPGLNEAGFRRNWLAARELPFWRVPTINKSNPDKDLRPILAGGLALGLRNSLPRGEMRRANRPEKISPLVIKFIKLLIFTNLTIVAARGVQMVAIRVLNGLKRGYKRAKKWRLDPVFARKVIAGNGMGLWPGRSFPSPVATRTCGR
jgi:hypothetical protein